MSKSNFASLVVALAIAALSSSSASASLITYDIHQGSDGGFGYSEIHRGYDWCDYMCGHTKTKLNGQLTFDYADGLYTVARASTLLGDTVTNWRGVTSTWSLEITDGAIASNGGGALDYTLRKGDWVSSGTFSFDGNLGMGPANSMDHDSLYLWGWSPDQDFGDIGIDLGGWAVPVPEPSAALVFGLGALALSRGTRRH